MRDLCELPLGGHLVYLKTQDFPVFGFNRKSNTHGLALGVDARFKVIKLYGEERLFRKALDVLLLRAPGLSSQEHESPADRFGVDLQDSCGAGLRDA